MVKTMPPLSISLASRGTAPDQNVKIPSSLKIRAAQLKLFLYSCDASIDCIRVLTVSSGIVTYLKQSETEQTRLGRRCDLHSDYASHTADTEGANGTQLLAGSDVTLCKLLQSGVTSESRGRIGGLAGSRGYEALEEAPNTPLLCNDPGAMQEAAHPWVCRLAVVNQLSLDTLKRRDSKQTLGDTSTKAGNDSTRPGDCAIGV